LALEHRLLRSGFADSSLGWQNFLRNCPNVNEEYRNIFRVASLYPNAIGLEKLIYAFRELNRIGDVTSVTLKATACAPWVIAFTRWFIGYPPSVVLDDGTVVIQQPSSRILLIANKDEGNHGLEVIVHRSIDTLAELVTVGLRPSHWTGMVSMESYGQWFRHEYGLQSGGGLKAMAQALPYALKQVITHFRPLHLKEFNHSIPLYEWHARQDDCKPVDNHLLKLTASPFPADTKVCRILSEYLIPSL
jgi:hypothetical protein